MAKYDFHVQVQPEYLPEESSPSAGVFCFAYRVSVTNRGEVPAQLVARQIFEPLTGRLRGPYSAGKPTRPGLVTGWSHSGDFRVWSARLRSGLRFQDGMPLDAAAVEANAERVSMA